MSEFAICLSIQRIANKYVSFLYPPQSAVSADWIWAWHGSKRLLTGGWKLSWHKCEIGGVIQMEGMVCINTTLCIDHIHVLVTHCASFLVIPLYLLLFWFDFDYLYIYTYSYFTNTSLEICLRTQYCLLRGVKKLNQGWYACTVA